MDDEIITIHFNGGTKAVARVTSEDLADEQMRVERLNDELVRQGRSPAYETSIECAEELVESALSVPPRPGWRWLGDAYVFTQAVAGIEYGAN